MGLIDCLIKAVTGAKDNIQAPHNILLCGTTSWNLWEPSGRVKGQDSEVVHMRDEDRGVLVFYLQDAWKQVSKVLQQGCVAFICQNKGRCSSSRQGTDLRDHFKKIKCEWIKPS